MLKYLIIGDASSMHIYNYIKNVLLPCNFDVHLMTLSIRPVRAEYAEYYKINNVKVYSVADKGYKDLEKIDKFHRLKNLFRKISLAKSIPDCDICHIHSVYKTSLHLYLQNKRKFKKLILSYWGGDIEDTKRSVVRLREKCFHYADAITVTVQQTYNDFINLYGNKYNEKLSICRFATEGLECIVKLSKTATREECRSFYGVKKDEICITCGYSAYAAQHQDLCLRMINSLDFEIKKKLHVIVPMQYGRFDEQYIDAVYNISKECDFKCTILEEFLPFEDSAKLPIATDIYLHLRDTDAFSNALKEHVLAKSRIIIGSWLKYPELEQMKADVEYIHALDDLTEKLNEMLQTIVVRNDIVLFMPIYDMYSTENVKNQWLSLINRMNPI